MKILDIHTHNLAATDALISVSPDSLPQQENRLFSVGIHPWNTESVSQQKFQALERAAINSNVLAIGECGLDLLRGAPVDIQKCVFEFHIALSEKYHKPLIIHQVKALQEILYLKKKFHPAQPWLIHGFRGKPETVRQLISNDLHFSIGTKTPIETIKIIPMEWLFLESDDTNDFQNLICKVSVIRGVSTDELAAILNNNNKRFLSL